METLHKAAEAALAVYENHWLKNWVRAGHIRIASAKNSTVRRMAAAGLHADIETIMEDVPQLL